MNVARFNFSHGDHAYHTETLANLKDVLRETRRICAVLLDTKGPEIRTGVIKADTVQLKKGEEIELVCNESFEGDEKRVCIQYRNLPKVVEVGDRVLIDDGLIGTRVVRKTETSVFVEIMNNGELGSRKGVNLPGVKVDLPAVTQKDVEDITFGVENNVDFVAASFIRKAEDVLKIRSLLDGLGPRGERVKIISKIENQEGLDNFEDILEVSDGIMVARGDLGVEIPLELVGVAQKTMIRKCNLVGKPVVTATQMLESMIVNPSPTRAEASDVANAVFDGTDCVMLSGEVAKGKYPVESVQMMSDICKEAELSSDFRAMHTSVRQSKDFTVAEAIASAAVKACFEIKAALVIVLTQTGRTSTYVAKHRPPCPILTITADEAVARQCLISKGLFPLLVGSMFGTESLIHRAVVAARKLGMVEVQDKIVLTSGAIEAISGGTNMMKVLEVKNYS